MGSTAWVIAIGYVATVVIVVLAAVAVALSTRRGQEIDPRALARRETTWLWVVLVLLGSLLAATILFTPYGESAGADRQVVRVTSFQFGFQVRPTEVEAGRPVEFRLTSRDVNHGFGVYDEDDVLVLQVQVMPGRTQKAVHTFQRAGRYRILCLEFCGVGHHLMTGSFTVAR